MNIRRARAMGARVPIVLAVAAPLLMLLAGLVRAGLSTNNAVSVTETSQTITLGTSAAPASDVFIVNDSASANETYHRLFNCGETVTAATTTGARLQPGDFRSYRRSQTDTGTGYCAVTIVCAGGETATARIEWK